VNDSSSKRQSLSIISENVEVLRKFKGKCRVHRFTKQRLQSSCWKTATSFTCASEQQENKLFQGFLNGQIIFVSRHVGIPPDPSNGFIRFYLTRGHQRNVV